jgi:hypothetical protein
MALPAHRPVDNDKRAAIAWWTAAHAVRATRQRPRLVHLVGDGHGEKPSHAA